MGPNFKQQINALISCVDATADIAADDLDLSTVEATGYTETDITFYIDDSVELMRQQSLFLEAVAARYRRALARAINARLFTERV